MAAASNLTTSRFLPLSNPTKHPKQLKFNFPTKGISSNPSRTTTTTTKASTLLRRKRRNWVVASVKEEVELEDIEIQELDGDAAQIGELESGSSSGAELDGKSEEKGGLVDRTVNAAIVLVAGTFAITRLLTIDHDYWQGWTFYEILRYAPEHNWIAYEEALKSNPVLSKMVISGVVYSVGDWIAQCYEGKPLFEFDRTRAFRSGLVGFTLHGSLSHYYYQFCEALVPSDNWWIIPAKVAFDQTIWAGIWNIIYFVVLGFLRFESPANIFDELKATFLPLLTAGWKLWPFAHIITYGVIPLEQRLLWVDCVELIWVTILSTYSNEKSETRNAEASLETNSEPSSGGPPKK